MSDATMLEDADLRQFAQDELDRHTPANQEHNGYERCALCHFTRHPCDVYDLAAAVLRLLDRLDNEEDGPPWPLYEHLRSENEKLSLALIEARNPGIDMDEVRRERAERLTTVVVQHDASFNEWHAGDPPGPGQPGDASDAT